MNNLTTYIIEKLKINKDVKLDIKDKGYLVSEIIYQVKHCLEDEYQRYQYKITLIDEQKIITHSTDKVWYVEVEFNSFNKKTMNNMTKSLQNRLNDILTKGGVRYYPITDAKSIYKIFLYDPE